MDDALDGTGVRRDDLTAEARVPFSAALRLLERTAALSGRPHLGLLVGARSDHRVLGLVGTMMSHAQTLGDALRDYVAVQLGYSRGATIYLQPMGADDILGYGLYDRAAPDSLQLYDLGAAAGCNFVRSLTGGRARGARVLLSRSTPPETAPDLSLLKMPVAFDQEQTGVVISAADMTTSPLPGANAAEHRRLIARICELMGSDIDDIAARVQHILRPRLLLGEGGRAEVARGAEAEWAHLRAPARGRGDLLRGHQG
ncbi:AraC family transcriptional regulator ligand-binding domain-containing protein [Xanthobacter sp. V2C-8]|uniref:AraC family transcriptional regulator ligand-binding domain-containing protein n=1 Tax=Xanthobacter albus TaxID=3119929 RepID=UPI0037280951